MVLASRRDLLGPRHHQHGFPYLWRPVAGACVSGDFTEPMDDEFLI
jgi:hypothetical protein